MLQAKDASSVDYKNLSPKDKKIFDASRLVEMNGLFDLGAYELLSLEESLKFRHTSSESTWGCPTPKKAAQDINK